MCKILAFTNTSKLDLKRHVNAIGNTLLKLEKDGFGYAVQGKRGVFGEKTVSHTFRTRLNNIDRSVVLPIVKSKYTLFGQPDTLTGPGLFHGRTSTNVISLVDTHPMQRGGWSLIHNGVVQDHGPDYTKNTNNDSEDVLYRLIEGYADDKQTNVMVQVEKYLEGYFAFAAIDTHGRMHIARDQYATLFIARSEVYDTFIIATTESLLLKANKILDAKIGPIDEVEDKVYMVFNGNELVHWQNIKPRGYAPRQAAHAQASLGRVLSPNATNSVYGSMSDDKWNEILREHNVQRRSNLTDADKSELKSEADWHNAVDKLVLEQQADKDEETPVLESDYYQYRNELDNMDASYQIFTPDDKPITLIEWRRMDHINQELCTILRGDGTLVDCDPAPHYKSGAM